MYTQVAGQAAVTRQPHDAEERTSALQALLACPTSSIRTEKPPADINRAQSTIPIRVPLPAEEEGEDGGGVYHLAYHSEQSYGAAPYLIRLRRRRRNVNVMVDSPRWGPCAS